MPDKRSHRGPHPEDAKLFESAALPDLRAAVADYSLLLSKGYADKSVLKLVGDRFSLTRRQRLAVMRGSCSDGQLQMRQASRLNIAEVSGCPLAIDGYNLLITIEAALGGAPIFRGRDGCLRDLASLHGTYRRVSETLPALELIGGCLETLPASDILWLLDRPVSNSGRLKGMMAALADEKGWPWEVSLSANPDAELKETERVVVSSDSVVLDACRRWVNLAEGMIGRELAGTRVIDLGEG